MLNIERHDAILKLLKHKKNIKLQEILENLNISEATTFHMIKHLKGKGIKQG